MSIVAVVVITVFVLPRFKTFFKSLHAKLPLPTRMLIAIANFFDTDWFVFVGRSALVLASSSSCVAHDQRARALRDRVPAPVPVLGDLDPHRDPRAVLPDPAARW